MTGFNIGRSMGRGMGNGRGRTGPGRGNGMGSGLGNGFCDGMGRGRNMGRGNGQCRFGMTEDRGWFGLLSQRNGETDPTSTQRQISRLESLIENIHRHITELKNRL